MNGKEMKEQLLQRRREQYHEGRAWFWPGASGTVKLGVIEAYQGAWMVGWVAESGAHRKLNSSALSKHQLAKDPAVLLAVVVEWAIKRSLKEVEW